MQVRNCAVRKVVTYSSLAASALAQLVEVEEEFLDAHAVASHDSLEALLDVLLERERSLGALVGGGVTVGTGGHVLHGVAVGLNCRGHAFI